jgi:hypothetical protein
MRIMLDECIAPRASRVLIDILKLHKPPLEARFLVDHVGAQGALDYSWTKELEEQGDWIVITSDNGRSRGERSRLKGPPLHLVLPARKITGFFMAGRMAQRCGFDKARCVIYAWPDILAYAESAPKGERFKIAPVDAGKGYCVYPWPLTGSLPTSL